MEKVSYRTQLIGRRFGRLIVTEYSHSSKLWRAFFKCTCDCGAEKVVAGGHLVSGATVSCGCYRQDSIKSRLIDLTGRTFSRLTVLAEAERRKTRHCNVRYWQCRCQCGKLAVVSQGSLTSGNTTSCGCRLAEMWANTALRVKSTHGLSNTRGYTIWSNMMRRCYTPTHKAYANYGAKGIQVCSRWHSVVNFITDMGQPSDGLTIDRVDNALGYSPENCRWATRVTQARNRSVTVIVEFKGERAPLAELCERFKVNYKVAYDRIYRYHWSIERTLTTPLLLNGTGIPHPSEPRAADLEPHGGE